MPQPAPFLVRREEECCGGPRVQGGMTFSVTLAP